MRGGEARGRRGQGEERGKAESVEEKKRGREEDEEKRRGDRAMHTLPSRRDVAMGRRETAAVSGRERDRREEGKNAFVDCSIE